MWPDNTGCQGQISEVFGRWVRFRRSNGSVSGHLFLLVMVGLQGDDLYGEDSWMGPLHMSVRVIRKLQQEIFDLTGGYIATWLPHFCWRKY